MEPAQVPDWLLEALPANAPAFFAFFARFEYALKKCEFVKEGPSDAQPDWNNFAGSLGQDFFQEVLAKWPKLRLAEQPPKRQVALNEKLAWQEVSPPNDVRSLLEAVRRCRNNLVHGGKMDDEAPDRVRDEALLNEGLHILNLALSKNECLQQAFYLPA